MSDMDEIVREFLIESNEGLDQMDRDLVELEKNPGCAELLASIFRSVHTIKGTSGVLGFPRLEAVAHAGENLLSRLRDGKLRLTPEMATVLLTLVDALRAKLQQIESAGAESDCDDTRIIDAVSAFLFTDAEQGRAEPNEHTPPLLGEIFVNSGVNETAIADALQQQNQGDPRRIGEILVSNGTVQPEAVLDALKKQGAPQTATVSGNIRVAVGLLDKVMNLVGELVLARNQVLQYTANQKDPTFVSTAQRLNLITTELQEGVMKTRMQPIGNVWSKFPRVVRDLAASCGKQVRIDLQGSETELDKTIIEAIKDPLTHIVRNSIDHGIESPALRQASGKPPEGTILLRAFHEGGQVNIEIEDDGGGVDLTRVREKALAKGLVSPERLAQMTDREITALIFVPGFSTAEKVSNVSGRGVGMDVVKTNVEKIGGTVDVHSVQGQGTTLKIKIPLTLAIIPALIVTSGAERFAIPQVSLVELVRLGGNDSSAIETVQGAPVYRLRGNLLPLVFLNRELGLKDSNGGAAANTNIVVLHADGRQFGLVVDDINDTEEIVVKPLGKHLKGLSCFAGATIMGDGQVALILDVLGIAQKADVICETRENASATLNDIRADQMRSAAQWLVFNAGANSRMAVPLSAVARLEEIKSSAVERAGDAEVVQYRGQIMPLMRVDRALGSTRDVMQREPLQVIVYTQSDKSVGLVVNEILDVVEEDVVIDEKTKRAGLLGSAVIQKYVTDLVDLETLARAGLGSAYHQGGGA